MSSHLILYWEALYYRAKVLAISVGVILCCFIKDCVPAILRRIKWSMSSNIINALLQGSIEGIALDLRRKVRCFKTCGVFKEGMIYDAAKTSAGVYSYFVWLDASQYEYFANDRFRECFSGIV